MSSKKQYVLLDGLSYSPLLFEILLAYLLARKSCLKSVSAGHITTNNVEVTMICRVGIQI